MNYVADEPTSAKEILKDTYKENGTFALVDDVYFVGMLDDAAFEQNESLAVDKIKSDYDGVLIFGITLHPRENNLLPTRSQLAEISRAFNREFYYTPVVLVFKYKDDDADYIAFANTERLKYKQEWREGEKSGKVSLLRDINIKKPHRGHEDIINQLKIPISGKNQVDSFAKLYTYWQEVFNVSILNKKFYNELQNWYFWALKEVRFPNEPGILDEYIDGDEVKLQEAIKEHKGKNVIRLLTRILFIWFIKEKKLIPEEIFDEQIIADKLIDDFTPQKPHGVFATGKHNSKYYRAILQNLFFATLNQEMGKRNFRNDKQHQNVTNLMRYKSYFKDPDYFVHLMEEIVPFMNGGLFECLDKPHPDKKGRQGGDIIIYADGFSDRADNFLEVPDYLFFDVDEEVDLSDDFGSKSKVYKNAKTRGLLEILKSYKFTITENTPIEEDVALDPELLGKVFENLLASYNPETKTTARKQTGSFYTPREIVNYMVDESLIAYLKNAIPNWEIEKEQLDKDLHQLFSFDNANSFSDKPLLQKQIIKALDKCTILDPACGSGAFPMGALQKMVHVLHKVDPNGQDWKQRQIDKVNNAIESLEEIEDSQIREQSIKDLELQKQDIEDAFENNELDYGRKLFLIENCIYGVDIQSIATQISKLRFFISLVVDQKIDSNKANFGVRPLPNLVNKFVAANTLIGIDKPSDQLSLYDTKEVKNLEKELKKIRHKLFSAKTKDTKLKYRQKDEELRIAIAQELTKSGWANDTADKLASWDPYDQNASSPFFDSEWMFDMKNGFDVVIGNPPYVQLQANGGSLANIYQNENYLTFARTGDIYALFYENGVNLLSNNGLLCFITSNKWMRAKYGEKLRTFFSSKNPLLLLDLGPNVFETATVDTNILLIENSENKKCLKAITLLDHKQIESKNEFNIMNVSSDIWSILSKEYQTIKGIIEDKGTILSKWDIEINRGILTGFNDAFIIDSEKRKELIEREPKAKEIIKPILRGKDIDRYKNKWKNYFMFFIPWHFPLHTNKSITGNSVIAEKEFMNQYPVIYSHLLHYKSALSKRNKSETGIRYEWYALQRCAATYYYQFERSKIIYQEMVQESSFYYDKDKHFFCNDTGRIITGKHLEYLTALLNSKLFFFSIKHYYGGGALGSTGIRMKHTFFENFPAIKPTKNSLLPFLTNLIQFAKIIEHSTEAFEKNVDALVLNLYFTEHMQEKEIDVLPFIEKDIATVMQKHPSACGISPQGEKFLDFEKLTDTEKEAVIEQLHQTWSHPDNEVVKRVALFKEKSPEILKPILES